MEQFYGYLHVMVEGQVMFLLLETLDFWSYLNLMILQLQTAFKIKLDLTMKQCHFAIPPSAAKGNQMISDEVAITSFEFYP